MIVSQTARRCPHCGGEISTTPLQDRVESLADGTKTANEIADLVETSPESVRAAVHNLKKRGESVSLKAAEKYPRPNIERDTEIFDDWGRGLGYKSLSAKYSVHSSRIGQIIKKEFRKRQIATLEQWCASADHWNNYQRHMGRARGKIAHDLRSSGKTFREVGAALGVTSARASQICAKYDRYLRGRRFSGEEDL